MRTAVLKRTGNKITFNTSQSAQTSWEVNQTTQTSYSSLNQTEFVRKVKQSVYLKSPVLILLYTKSIFSQVCREIGAEQQTHIVIMSVSSVSTEATVCLHAKTNQQKPKCGKKHRLVFHCRRNEAWDSSVSTCRSSAHSEAETAVMCWRVVVQQQKQHRPFFWWSRTWCHTAYISGTGRRGKRKNRMLHNVLSSVDLSAAAARKVDWQILLFIS